MLMVCERKSVNPMVEPIFNPNEREMMKYSPPPSTRVLVANSEIANAVGIVIKCPRRIIAKIPKKPNVPSPNPNLRNRIAPKIEEIAVKNTGAVPNPFFVPIFAVSFAIFFFCQNR